VRQQNDAERALAASESRFHAVVNHVPVGIALGNTAGECIFVNDRWCEIAGWTRQEVLGHGWRRALHPADADRVLAQWSAAMRERRLFEGDARLVTRDGRAVWVRATASAFAGDGESTAYIATFTDITERHHAERALRAIVEGTAGVTEADFFRAFVRHLAEAFSVRVAVVSEIANDEGTRARTLALWVGDGYRENFEYELAGTPCEDIVHKTTCHYPDRLQERFPNDRWLVEEGLESYLACRSSMRRASPSATRPSCTIARWRITGARPCSASSRRVRRASSPASAPRRRCATASSASARSSRTDRSA
jgi:PAS domain S-box-containing protein